MSADEDTFQVSVLSYRFSTVSADGPGRAVRFAAHRQPLYWNFMYHLRIVLSVGGSVWCMALNLRCTGKINSVLENSKTQNAFLFPAYAIFSSRLPPNGEICKYATAPSTPTNLRDSLPIDMFPSAVWFGCWAADFEIFGETYELSCTIHYSRNTLPFAATCRLSC
jgi:hypothetical protein